jgi:hypothetical protein
MSFYNFNNTNQIDDSILKITKIVTHCHVKYIQEAFKNGELHIYAGRTIKQHAEGIISLFDDERINRSEERYNNVVAYLKNTFPNIKLDEATFLRSIFKLIREELLGRGHIAYTCFATKKAQRNDNERNYIKKYEKFYDCCDRLHSYLLPKPAIYVDLIYNVFKPK